MPASQATLPEYLPASGIREHLRVSAGCLLRWVVTKKVRTLLIRGEWPQYHVGDVRKAIASRPPRGNLRDRTVPRNGTAAAAAKPRTTRKAKA
jgi:hypothetical protein